MFSTMHLFTSCPLFHSLFFFAHTRVYFFFFSFLLVRKWEDIIVSFFLEFSRRFQVVFIITSIPFMLNLGLFQWFQKHRFYLKKEKVILQPNTSQILQTCTQIIDYENKIYLIYFISIIFIVKPLENVFSTNHWIFFFLFCIVLPKKGIYNEHTSTSFVIDCANNIITAASF